MGQFKQANKLENICNKEGIFDKVVTNKNFIHANLNY